MPEASELARTQDLEPSHVGPALVAPAKSPPAAAPLSLSPIGGGGVGGLVDLGDNGERLRLEEALMGNAEAREAMLGRVEEAVLVGGKGGWGSTGIWR